MAKRAKRPPRRQETCLSSSAEGGVRVLALGLEGPGARGKKDGGLGGGELGRQVWPLIAFGLRRRP